jgi:hypothetical protein
MFSKFQQGFVGRRSKVTYEELRELELRVSGFEWESARKMVTAWLKGDASHGG